MQILLKEGVHIVTLDRVQHWTSSHPGVQEPLGWQRWRRTGDCGGRGGARVSQSFLHVLLSATWTRRAHEHRYLRDFLERGIYCGVYTSVVENPRREIKG